MGQKIKDVMTKDAQVVKPDDTIKHAAVTMEAMEVGPLPVCDGERLVGMLTDRDIATRIVASGRDPNSTTVREAMTAEVLYCFEDQSLEDAAKVMKDKQVRRLPVLNRAKRLVGMVALGDLATRGGGRTAESVLEQVSQPTGEQRS